MIYRVLLIVSLAGSACADFLPLPHWCAPLEIYHIKTTQISGYSCGFNALFNACSLERVMGITNPCSNFAYFQAVCAEYMNTSAPGQTTKGSLTNEQIMQLCGKMGLYSSEYFSRHHGSVAPHIGHISVKYPRGSSQAYIQQLLEQKRISLEQEGIQALQNYSFDPQQRPFCLHFFCGISTKKHVILITLIVNKGRRILCVCDNMNELYQQSDLEQFLAFFASTFDVSTKQSSQPFYLFPARWPGIR